MIRIKPVVHVICLLLLFIAAFMMVPMLIALFGSDGKSALAFGLSISITVVVSLFFWFLTRPGKENQLQLRAREGFVLVSFAWIMASAVGALPFMFSGVVQSYTDAFFETISGFTTTGASILVDIEATSDSVLFWRSLTHWLGGMGIVVLTVAILPFLGVGAVQLFRAESPGPTLDKMAPRITQSAKILWFTYLGMTVLQTLLLMAGGMSLFDSLTHTFGTLATGGFSPRAASVGAYDSAYIQWVITIFMVMAGVNFNLYFRLFNRNFRQVFRNTELQVYLAIFLVAVLIVGWAIYGEYGRIGVVGRHAAFQVASILTTTGYAIADFDLWPMAARGVLFLLMFIGGCSGSTGGGPKVVRIMALAKLAVGEMKYLSRPSGVFLTRINGEPLRKGFLYPVCGFIVLYFILLIGVTLVVSIFGTDLNTGFSTALATVGNIGPGFGLVGPTMNYAFYHPFIKWLLSFAMLAGRLEIYTVLILLSPSFWSRN